MKLRIARKILYHSLQPVLLETHSVKLEKLSPSQKKFFYHRHSYGQVQAALYRFARWARARHPELSGEGTRINVRSYFSGAKSYVTFTPQE